MNLRVVATPNIVGASKAKRFDSATETNPRKLAIHVRPEDLPLKPLNQNVAIVEVAKEEVTRSGIVLPETLQSEEIIEQGRVLAVAEDCTMNLKLNDIVFYSKFIPQDMKIKVKIDDKEVNVKLFIIPQKDIMAVMTR